MNWTKALALIVGAFLLAGTTSSRGDSGEMALPPGEHARNYLSGVDNTFQPWHLFVPSAAEKGEPLPLAVVLHGRGATWQAWFHATTVTDWAEAEGYFVAAPHGRGDWFYHGPGEQDVLDVMAEVEALFPIDKDRVYIMGHSMGGYGALHLAAAYPDKFASVVAMSCWAPLDRLENLRHAQPLLMHGLADDVVPPEGTGLAAGRLEELGIAHRHVPLPGRGHESSLISDSLLFIGEWLRDKERTEEPRGISLRLYTPSHGSAWWVRVLQVRTPGDLAALDAQVLDEDEVLEISTGNVARFTLRREVPGLNGVGYTVKLDGEDFALPEEDGPWLLFERERRVWTVSAAENPPGATVPNFGVASHVPKNMPQAIARTLQNRVEADAFLLPEVYAAREVLYTHWTLDVLLDLYLHPEDEIHVAELTSAEFDTLLETRDDWYPGWWDELIVSPPLPEDEDPEEAEDADAEADPEAGDDVVLEDGGQEFLRVAFPAVLAEKIAHESSPTGITVRRTLVEHVASGQLLRE